MAYMADKPVLRFLEHGGPLAVDFVERRREMALRFAERGRFPCRKRWASRPRIMREYQAWLEGHARPSLRKRATYRRPVLLLDPWGLGAGPSSSPQPALAAESGPGSAGGSPQAINPGFPPRFGRMRRAGRRPPFLRIVVFR